MTSSDADGGDSQRDAAARESMRQAFAGCPRPSHFTNHRHCSECAEHDATLLARTPDTLTRDDVGTFCWSPIPFTTPEGFAYFLPGQARLVLDDADPAADWFGPQFLSTLLVSGPVNERYQHCSPTQRAPSRTSRLIWSRPGQASSMHTA